jgi:hypothetical protein
MQSTVPDLAAIAYGAAHLTMLVGLILIVFVPFFPGLAAVGLAALAYGGYAAYSAGTIDEFRMIVLAGIVVFSLAGVFSAWWSEKLGMRFTYVTPEVLWGAFIALILASVLNLSMFWQILALFLGATIAAIGVQKRSLKEGVMHGPVAIYSMLGPRGFQLLMALLVCDLAITHVLRKLPPALPGLR